MLFNIILMSSIVIVTGINKLFTKESLTNYGKLCMSDCIDNVCVTGRNDKKANCNSGSRPGLQYYTGRDRTQNKLCKSRCGKFDNSTDDWCYVSHAEWDYCNPEMGTKIVKYKAYTLSRGPCKDECKTKNNTYYVWCNTYWGDDWDYCHPEKFTYMQTKTRQGLDCAGICGTHENRGYNWCVSSEEKEARCAPVARNFTIFYNMFDQLSIRKNKDSCRIKADQPSFKHDSVPSGFVSRYADLLAYPNIGLLTEYLNQDGNPINVYTIMPYAHKFDPTLPIVVRARATPKTIRLPSVHRTGSFPFRVRENLQRLTKKYDESKYVQGEDGHIISNILGGPSEIYNFAAPTQRSDKSGVPPEWYDTEVLIRDFIVRTNGWAEITVVIVYSDISVSWKPDGYAVDFALYNNDNTLYRECNDYYYSNRDDQ